MLHTSCFALVLLALDNSQAGRRVLATDEWLRVLGCSDVYALGDCATISQRRVMVRMIFLFLISLLH